MDWKCYKAYIYITKTTHRKKKIIIIRKISSKLGNKWYNAIEWDQHQKGVHQNMNTVFDVANYILKKMGPLTTMKLQKLCYYSQAWSLAWDDQPLFEEEFQAWANGPVCPELFNAHRGSFVVNKEFCIDKANGTFTDSEKETIDKVISYYGDKTPQWLSDLTHSEEPWKFARKGLPVGVRSTEIISKESMQEYYGGL